MSQNKTEQIKCTDINKNTILPLNSVAPQRQLWVQQSGCRATHKVNKVVCYFVIRAWLSQSESSTGTIRSIKLLLKVMRYNQSLFKTSHVTRRPSLKRSRASKRSYYHLLRETSNYPKLFTKLTIKFHI